jgi:hypothetical protein
MKNARHEILIIWKRGGKKKQEASTAKLVENSS